MVKVIFSVRKQTFLECQKINIHLITGSAIISLLEQSVDCTDWIAIAFKVRHDLDIFVEHNL